MFHVRKHDANCDIFAYKWFKKVEIQPRTKKVRFVMIFISQEKKIIQESLPKA